MPVPSGGCWTIGQLPDANDTSCSQLHPLYSYEGYLREVTLWSTLLTARAVRGCSNRACVVTLCVCSDCECAQTACGVVCCVSVRCMHVCVAVRRVLCVCMYVCHFCWCGCMPVWPCKPAKYVYLPPVPKSSSAPLPVLCPCVSPPHASLHQIMSLMHQPPTGPAPFLVFGLVRVKSGLTGEAVIWMDATNALPAAFAGSDVATVFRGIGESSRCADV